MWEGEFQTPAALLLLVGMEDHDLLAPEGYPDGLFTQDSDKDFVAPVEVGGIGVAGAD